MAVDTSKTVSQVFKEIKRTLPTAVKRVTYNQITGNNVYDPETGETGSSAISTQVDAVLTSFKDQDKSVTLEDKVNRQFQVGDMKVLIPYEQLPIEVKMADTITIGSKTWNIIGREIEPTLTSLHKIIIRKS